MYIKQVIIHGFKSYRDQTVVEPFDKGHNVVVGRNGSGKSNFFYAIQFVLSDEFVHLRPDQRQTLLHEGSGPRVVSAYVDIIFDNSDNRVPIDQTEISLRRVIGAKKDQYMLNRKVVPRSEVMNLLESAGFSNSNPYYIVKQGKINQMATAPDSHRLKLLREVAGTRVYDERRDESLAILKETEGKLEKIVEFLRTIEERLGTLEEEKEELRQYQQLDKNRRALEYVIHDNELRDTNNKLEELQRQRATSGSEQGKLGNDLQRAQDEIKTLAKKSKETRKALISAKEERDHLSNDHQYLIKEKAKLDLIVKDLAEDVTDHDTSRIRANKELEILNSLIDTKEKDLERIKPEYEKQKRLEEECTRELALKEQKRKELYAKQGRGSQFASKEDRDKWIQTELKSLVKQLKDKESHRDKLNEDLKRDSAKQVELKTRIDKQNNEMERQRVLIDEHIKTVYELKKKKDAFQATRNEQWRKESSLVQNLSTLKEDLGKADQSLRAMVGKPILNGRDSVRKVLETFRARGGAEANIAASYYGPVIENFQCEQSIYTAVEVTAGNRLFHHVVESDLIGTQILKEMNKQKLPGEVTFMPLNRLNARKINYPADDNAIPMVAKLSYQERYGTAMRYLFGKTLICRHLDAATKLSREAGLDCVTLEGDQVSSQGSLTGGYFNTQRSRLEMQKTRIELMEQIDQCEAELKTLREQLKKTELEITNIVSETMKTETKNSKAKAIHDKVKGDLRLMKEELATIERLFAPKQRSLNQCKANLEAMQSTREGLDSELHQELLPQLSSADQKEVDKLNDDIVRLSAENKDAFSARIKLEAERSKLENLLQINLTRRRDELYHALQEINVENKKKQLETRSLDQDNTQKKIDKVNTDLDKYDLNVKDITKKLKAEQSKLEDLKVVEKKAQDKLDEDAKLLEKFASKQQVLENQKQDCIEKINNLGAIPSQDIIDSYKKMAPRQLFKELEKTNNNLKKFSHVNKKALDQFMSFSDQKEKLQKRKEELDRGDEKIKELLNMLEQRKMEAIQFTFKQISTFFSEVFNKLVPSGRGQLVMKTVDNDEGREIGPGDTNTDVFTGIGIKVSFTGADAEMREMNQLSGGQKSLVALALIFAIQKCDPAPFYLFDEIDQALDAQHRKSVANMIHELVGEAQFITTTFRPELLEHANKFYGVKFRNKVSHVDCVTREEARDFVEDDTTHG